MVQFREFFFLQTAAGKRESRQIVKETFSRFLRKKTILFSLLFISLFSAYSDDEKFDLIEISENKGITFYFDPLSRSGTLEKNGHQLSFSEDEDIVLKDGDKLLSVTSPFAGDNGRIFAGKDFVSSLDEVFISDGENNFKIGAILIDPGHGGKDPGANMVHTINGKKVNVVEKDINLKTGLLLYDMLKRSYPDKKILMTRNTDVFISLSQRTEIANKVKLEENEAILYVSIHVNASLDKKASGYEVWYLSPGYRRQVIDSSLAEDKSLIPILNSMMEEEFTTESILIAKFITEGIGAQVGNNSYSRGIKAEEWFVVRNANMPSVLVELGFLTNEKEAALLNSPSYLQKLALGIYNGLQAFVTHFERSRGFTGER